MLAVAVLQDTSMFRCPDFADAALVFENAGKSDVLHSRIKAEELHVGVLSIQNLRIILWALSRSQNLSDAWSMFHHAAHVSIYLSPFCLEAFPIGDRRSED
eukprot:gnl/TRDRNA2_/TRDRNA2_87263_c0_seq1.p1 gnl/TRDRNA2_/TRDRNA2_87263_c0~~gnl/TRDRNA2_/TRDRNA2_87263_c0_seq1.p1  ORF type:complete len:101 (+),score=9.13 gnl/TRDRNA2_/TRDRNA2_87263_c0_seq1:851-1153(+)